MRGLLIVFIAMLISCASANETSTLSQRVDAVFAEFTTDNRPGYAVGILRGGSIIHAKGYGIANLETGEVITVDTAFNLASLSKQFTGAAIALEIDRGRLDLDDSLATHWPNLPDFMSDITIGHLVYMTSGLKEYYTLPSPKGGWASEDKFTVDDAITAVFKSGELDYAPGSQWSYSNINYQLLAVLTAKLNDTPFSNHMVKSIFKPLAMQNTWVDAPLSTTRKSRAHSYISSDDNSAWKLAPRLSPHYGGSGMFSSINDLAKWDNELYLDKTLGDGFSALMLSTQKYDHDKTNDAFGLVHGTYEDIKTIWYEGGDYGASTYMVHLPARNETIICLANFNQGRCAEKARAILDIMISLESDGTGQK